MRKEENKMVLILEGYKLEKGREIRQKSAEYVEVSGYPRLILSLLV